MYRKHKHTGCAYSRVDYAHPVLMQGALHNAFYGYRAMASYYANENEGQSKVLP